MRVEGAKSCSDASYYHVAMLNRLGLFQHPLGRMLDVLETLANARSSGEGKDRMLGVIQNVLWLVFFVQRFAGDLVCDFDQLRKRCFREQLWRIARRCLREESQRQVA